MGKINLEKKITKCVILVFALQFLTFNLIFASVSYDAGTNTIFLEGSGTNTLSSIYDAPVVPKSALNYHGETNTYILSAYISGEHSSIADLQLNNNPAVTATLIFNNTASNQYYIEVKQHLAIENMIIKAENPVYSWQISTNAGYRKPYSLKILDSDISGGTIIGTSFGNGNIPTYPTEIKNNKFHDYTGTNHTLVLTNGSAVNAVISNNTFENCHMTFGQYNGILAMDNFAGCKIDQLYISSCSVVSYGMTIFVGTEDLSNLPAISNFAIKNCSGYGFSGKEWASVIIKDGTINNVSGTAIHLYRSLGFTPTLGPGKYWLWNVSIDGADTGIGDNGYDEVIPDIYNVRINNVGTAYGVNNKSVFFFFYFTGS